MLAPPVISRTPSNAGVVGSWIGAAAQLQGCIGAVLPTWLSIPYLLAAVGGLLASQQV
jgi:hypothetical protein